MKPLYMRNLKRHGARYSESYATTMTRYQDEKDRAIDWLLSQAGQACESAKQQGRSQSELERLQGQRAALHDMYFSRKCFKMSPGALENVISDLEKAPRGVRIKIAYWVRDQRQIPTEEVADD